VRAQWALLPLAVAVGVLIPLLEGLAAPREASNVCSQLTRVDIVGWRSGPPAALCAGDAALGEGALNVSALPRCFLLREGERFVLWLGPYRLRECKVYGRGPRSVVLVLEEGGRGVAYLAPGLMAGDEVHAVVREGGALSFTPVARAVSASALLEIRGSASGARVVEAYAYASPGDFNASQPPLRSLYVTEGEVVSGRFVLRVERGGPPYTPRGRPLLEVNSTLVLYTGCSHAVIDLANVTGGELVVNLDCRARGRSP